MARARRSVTLAAVPLLALALGLLLSSPASSSSSAAASSSSAEAPAPWLDLERFLARPKVLQVALSPDGERLAYRLREDSGSSVWTLDTATGERRKRLDSRLVSSLAWSRDGAGLFLETARAIAYLPADAGRPTLIAALDGGPERRFAGVDPSLPRHVLIEETAAEDELHRLLRFDAEGTMDVVYRSAEPIRSFLLDDLGRPAFVQGVDGHEVVIYRLPAGSVDDAARREILRCGVYDACALVAATDHGARLYLRSRRDDDLWRLVVLDTATGDWRTVHRDPEDLADLDQLALDPTTGRPLIASYDTDRRRSYGLEPGIAAQVARLQARLPDRALSIEARPAGRSWLVIENGARLQHARYHLYDPRSDRLEAILEAERQSVAALPAEHLVDKRFFHYRAGDGMRVHGFVSLPRGVDPRQAPLVALIHGGPWNHVGAGFSERTQFLANRGYVVFEPDFRASSGYGLAYLRAGRGEFGDGKVHQDILDGIDHLLAEGIGDPERVAIAGHSFGGFSALGGLAFSSHRFRAAIATAPPIDLIRSLEDMDDEATLANGLPQKALLLDLVVDSADPQAIAALRRRSPEQHLARTDRPLLIMAGAQDRKIDLVDVKHYALALDGLGKDVSLLIDDDAGHSFEPPPMRRAMLYLMERFLARHLGAPARTVADPRLQDYLEATLRLRGASLEQALAPPAVEGGGSG